MEACVFCKFADKNVIVYEDEVCFAAVSLNPINRYHVMVIPRNHFEDFVDLPDDLAAHLFVVTKKISLGIRKICTPAAMLHVSDDDIAKKGYNLVPHYKIHVIPRFENDGIKIDWSRSELTLEEREKIAQEVKRGLG